MESPISCSGAVSAPGLILDLVLILIVAVTCFIGAKKGFLGIMVSFFGGIITLVASTLLAAPLSELFASLGLRGVFADLFKDLFDGEVFTQTLAQLRDSSLDSLFASVSLPGFIEDSLVNMLKERIDVDSTLTAQQVLSEGLAGIAITAISFFVLFIIFSVIVLIVKRYAKALNNVPILGPLNKVLGALVSLIMGAGIVVIVTFPLSVLSGFLPEEFVALIDGSLLFKLLYYYNPIALIATKLL